MSDVAAFRQLAEEALRATRPDLMLPASIHERLKHEEEVRDFVPALAQAVLDLTEEPGGDAKRLEKLKAENTYLREREKHFAKVLGVCDGGRYRNDWDTRIERLVAENTRLVEELHQSRELEKQLMQNIKWLENCVSELEDSNASLEDDIQELENQ